MSETPLETLKRYERLFQEGLEPESQHWYEVASASYALGLWAQAARAYMNLLTDQRHAQDQELRFRLGVALTFAESPKLAIEHLTYAVECDECPRYLKGLGDALAILGESSLSRDIYLRCVEAGISTYELIDYDVIACIEALHQSVSALSSERLIAAQEALRRWREILEPRGSGPQGSKYRNMSDMCDVYDTLSLSHYVEALILKRLGDHEGMMDAYLVGAEVKRASLPPDWGALLELNRSIKRAYDMSSSALPAARSSRDDDRAQAESPVFILGMPRSGTSLTAQILSRHTQTTSLGERGVLYEALRGWSRVSEVESLRAPPLDEVAIVNRSWWTTFDDSASGAATRCLNLMSAHAQAQRDTNDTDDTEGAPSASWLGGRRYIDKTPSHHLFAGWIHEVFPRAKIIHCRRDPTSTCYSCFTHHFSSGHEWSYNLEEVALYYLAYDEMMSFWSARGVEMYELSLEALTAHPEREIKALLEFCELPWESACLSPEQSDALVYSSSLHQVREPIRARPAAWREIEHRLTPLINLLNLSESDRAELSL